MKRGRKPKPTVLHELQGTLNSTRHATRAREPVPTEDLADPPDWLSPGQEAAWRYAMEHAPRGLLRQIDRGILVIWVEAEDRHRTAAMQQAKLDRNNAMPLLTKSKDGFAMPSPYLSIITRAAVVMLKAAAELGFSPAARPRLSVDDPGRRAPNSGYERLRLLEGGKSTG